MAEKLADSIRKGGLVDARDVDGNTPLINAVKNPSKDQVESVKLLLENGANPNLKGRRGTTPIISAVAEGELAAIQLLIDAGGDINTKDIDDGSALKIAGALGREKVVRLLLSNGASTNSEVFRILLESPIEAVRNVTRRWLHDRTEVSSSGHWSYCLLVMN